MDETTRLVDEIKAFVVCCLDFNVAFESVGHLLLGQMLDQIGSDWSSFSATVAPRFRWVATNAEKMQKAKCLGATFVERLCFFHL